MADSVDIAILETLQNGRKKWCEQIWTQFSLKFTWFMETCRLICAKCVLKNALK